MIFIHEYHQTGITCNSGIVSVGFTATSPFTSTDNYWYLHVQSESQFSYVKSNLHVLWIVEKY